MGAPNVNQKAFAAPRRSPPALAGDARGGRAGRSRPIRRRVSSCTSRWGRARSSVSSSTRSQAGRRWGAQVTEVPPNAVVRMVAVEPEESDGLFPPLSDASLLRIQKADAPVSPRPDHVAEEGRPVFGAELAASRAHERLVGLDCIHRGAVAVLGAAGERDGRAPPVTPHLDDAAIADLPGKAVEQHGSVTGKPSFDRGHVPELLRPISVFRRQGRESSGRARPSRRPDR